MPESCDKANVKYLEKSFNSPFYGGNWYMIKKVLNLTYQ